MGEGEEEGPYKGLGPPTTLNTNLNLYTGDVSFDDSFQYFSPNDSFNNSNDMR